MQRTTSRCHSVSLRFGVPLTALLSVTGFVHAGDGNEGAPRDSVGIGAILFISVDGLPPTTATLNGIVLANGNRIFLGALAAEDGAWTVNYNLIGDSNPNPQVSLTGTLKVTNNTLVTHAYSTGFVVPICPPIENGSLIGGAITVTLNSNGPGTLACTSGLPVVQALANGQVAQSVFYCPFSLGTTGSGTASSNSIYGLPGPSINGPRLITSIGEQLQYSLTSLDSATVQVSMLYKDTDGAQLDNCPCDLDGDGVVGSNDLEVLLHNWGDIGWCPQSLVGDIDLNGVVETNDLNLLLSAWGYCNAPA